MPTTSQPTRSGTPKLSEVARKVVQPTGVTTTGWPAVRKTCREKLGITFDPWQDQAGGLILTKRADGKLAVMIDGVGMSLPRQVGKTYLIAGLTFALCVNQPGLLVIWTAHHMKTSGETFLALQAFAERAKVKPHIRQVFTGSGDEEIRFHNGSRILFGARERGFGRGIPGVDMLIFDEAQILSDKAMSNMLATLNTSDFGLQLYIGTPPKPEDMSESFTRMRTSAYAGTLVDGAWIEFGADPDADIHDRKQWRKMNPSYPKRTPAESILRLQRKLTEADFRREGMGIWDDAATLKREVPDRLWNPLKTESPPTEGRTVYGVKFSPDGGSVALGVALKPDDGPTHVEGIEHRAMADGVGWLVDWLAERWRTCDGIVIDGKSGAGDLENALRARKVSPKAIITPNVTDIVTAHAMFLNAIRDKNLTHYSQDGLNASIAAAMRRNIGQAGGWGWAPIGDGSVTLLESVTLAHFGAHTSTRHAGRRTKAVIM